MKKPFVILVIGLLFLGCISPPTSSEINLTVNNSLSAPNASSAAPNASSPAPNASNTSPVQTANASIGIHANISNTSNISSTANNTTVVAQNASSSVSLQLAIPASIESNCVGFLVGDSSELYMVSLIGGAWARPHPGPFSWGFIEKTPGTYDFSETDTWVKAAQQNNVAMLATIWPFADWDQTCKQGCEVDSSDQFYPSTKGGFTSGIPAKRCAPCNMTAYKKFIARLAERYDGDGIDDMPGLKLPIKYYEVLNEPEMNEQTLSFFKGSTNDYLELLKSSHEAIKNACNGCTIVQGGAAGTDFKFLSFWETMYSSGASQYVDIANIHYIGTGDRDTLNVKKFKQTINNYGANKSIWVTEAQYSSKDSITSSFEGALNAGASKVFFVSFKIGEMGPPVPGEYSSEYATLPGKCKSS